MKIHDTIHDKSPVAGRRSRKGKCRYAEAETACNFKWINNILKTESGSKDKLNEALSTLKTSAGYPAVQRSPVVFAGIKKCQGIVLCTSAAFYDSLSDKEKTIHTALHVFKEALGIYMRIQRPAACAGTLENIGIAYYRLAVFHESREKDYKKNRGMAVQTFKRALEIATVEKYPAEYAKIQNDIGIIYSERIYSRERYSLERSEDLNRSIHAFKKALGVYTVKKYPLQFAETQSNMGTAYSKLVRFRDSEKNINRSIHAFEEALSVYSFEKHPAEYTKIQISLAEAYKRFANNNTYYDFVTERIQACGEKQVVRAYAEQAAQAYHKALRIYTVAEYPITWYAEMQKKIADVHRIIAGFCNSEEDAELSAEAYHKALRAYTPVQYKEIQNNLGTVYGKLAQFHNKEENLNRAIQAFKEALSLNTDENSFPQWVIQAHLGDAYGELAQIQNMSENARQAIQAYGKAIHSYSQKEDTYSLWIESEEPN